MMLLNYELQYAKERVSMIGRSEHVTWLFDCSGCSMIGSAKQAGVDDAGDKALMHILVFRPQQANSGR